VTPADDSLRLAAYERVRAAVDALAQLGPASQVVDRCPDGAAAAADLDRVILSGIEHGTLVVERVYVTGHDDGMRLPALRSELRLSYPLLECELLRRRRAQLVVDIDRSQPARYAFLKTTGWESYVAAPILVEGTAIALLHGDRAPGRRPLCDLDADALEHFAAGFAVVFERAVLRRRLRDQRREIRRISSWAEARAGEHGEGAITLSGEPPEESERRASAPELVTEDGLAMHLTARELDVLRLLADGKTNGDIARALYVSEGTVKFHVKNILRKMQASNRADASARYLRLTLHVGSALPTPTLR
jgi:DNA-binding CsgD family transcriptional regulator